jgi:hypothetical protein
MKKQGTTDAKRAAANDKPETNSVSQDSAELASQRPRGDQNCERKSTDSRPANGPPVNPLNSWCTHGLQRSGF